MSERIRLDAYLVACKAATSRSEAKKLLKKKSVVVNDVVSTAAEQKIDPQSDVVTCAGTRLSYKQFEYYLLNKPAGYITANRDEQHKTVMDLLPFLDPEAFSPVGRLDKDTEGLLLITNDGNLAHRLLSPKKHVAKTYYVRVRGTVSEVAAGRLKDGIEFSDFTSKPAQYQFLSYDSNDDVTEAELTIVEGKFHQVKRMFAAVGNEVLYLRRISMGGLTLPKELALGDYIELDDAQVSSLSS